MHMHFLPLRYLIKYNKTEYNNIMSDSFITGFLVYNPKTMILVYCTVHKINEQTYLYEIKIQAGKSVHELCKQSLNTQNIH